nr:hypothetical protein [Tanacetum cinerariifolium]
CAWKYRRSLLAAKTSDKTRFSIEVLNSGKDFFANLERNQFRLANFPLRLWTSLIVRGDGSCSTAAILSGHSFIPSGVTTYPKNTPSATTNVHFLGLSFIVQETLERVTTERFNFPVNLRQGVIILRTGLVQIREIDAHPPTAVLFLYHDWIGHPVMICTLSQQVAVSMSWNDFKFMMRACDVPPPPSQLYLSPKKDLSWTGPPECADDMVTDYSKPSPTIESTSCDDQNKNSSVTKTEASPSTISPKPFIKFVKAVDKAAER